MGSPLITSAVSGALAPGSTVYLAPAAMHPATNASPGSLMPGIPASLTKAIASPESTRSAISSARCLSLCSWQAISGFFIPRCVISSRVLRVSSQYTALMPFSVSIVRSVMSDRLPIGVAQRYSMGSSCTVVSISLIAVPTV